MSFDPRGPRSGGHRPTAPHQVPPAWARRDVLSLAAAGVTASAVLAFASGCGLRWEADTHDLPVLERDRWEGADLLLAELGAVTAAITVVGGMPDATLLAAHREQEAALRERLREAHEDAPSSAPSAPAGRTPPPVQRVVEVEWAGLMDGDGSPIAPSHPAGDENDVLLVGSVQVARLAFGRRAGGAWPAPSPEDGIRHLEAQAATTLLEQVRSAVYRLQIVASRLPQADARELPPDTETVAGDTLDALQRLETDLVTGAATPTPPPLGYPHSQPSTPAQLRDEAVAALSAVADAAVLQLPSAWPIRDGSGGSRGGGSGQNDQLDTTVYTALRTRAADLEHWRLAWGGQLRGTPALVR